MVRLLLDHESHGWLDVTIEYEDKIVEIPASFLSDCIESLVSALCLLAEGNRESIATLQTEPGEYRLVFKNLGNMCEFLVYEFDDNFHTGGLDKGNCIFLANIVRKQLLKNFLHELRILHKLGNEEYKRIWGYEFPSRLFERLEKAYKELSR